MSDDLKLGYCKYKRKDHVITDMNVVTPMIGRSHWVCKYCLLKVYGKDAKK